VLIASIDGVKLRRPVVPGDQLRLEIIGHRIKSTSATISGRAMVGTSLAAEAKLRFVMVDAHRDTGSLVRAGSPHRVATVVR
jgi:3-hydroxymyristoyl/3-hydroxydecanoyl-(acyl carrier protein) dehydratase